MCPQYIRLVDRIGRFCLPRRRRWVARGSRRGARRCSPAETIRGCSPDRTSISMGAEMHFTLPDGDKLDLPDGATGADAAAAIGAGLARAALAVKVDGAAARPGGAAARRRARAALEILTERSGADALELIRHDCAHVLAAAVIELYPGVQDLDRPPDRERLLLRLRVSRGRHLSEADFAAIEAEMRQHIAADEQFVREDVPVATALERFRGGGSGLQGGADRGSRRSHDGVETVSLYTNGPFTDLCRGPHAPARSGSRRSSCSRSRAPTGAAMPTGRC